MYQGIEHITLTARDAETLAAWYCEMLGFEEYYRSDGAIFLRSDNSCMIEVLEGAGGANLMLGGNKGAAVFAIGVDSLDDAIQDLRRKGIELIDEPMQDAYCRVQFFRDGEQNLLHLVERH